MQGGIYRIRVQDHSADEYHPHVVLMEFNDDCLAAPAFSSGGEYLHTKLDALQKMGLSRDLVAVEIDNSRHVTWVPGRSGNLAHWCIWRLEPPIPKKLISASQKIGQMSDAGMLTIFDCAVRLADARPEWFSRKRIKRFLEMQARFQALVAPENRIV